MGAVAYTGGSDTKSSVTRMAAWVGGRKKVVFSINLGRRLGIHPALLFRLAQLWWTHGSSGPQCLELRDGRHEDESESRVQHAHDVTR